MRLVLFVLPLDSPAFFPTSPPLLLDRLAGLLIAPARDDLLLTGELTVGIEPTTCRLRAEGVRLDRARINFSASEPNRDRTDDLFHAMKWAES
jgi:hypothetical protein